MKSAEPHPEFGRPPGQPWSFTFFYASASFRHLQHETTPPDSHDQRSTWEKVRVYWNSPGKPARTRWNFGDFRGRYWSHQKTMSSNWPQLPGISPLRTDRASFPAIRSSLLKANLLIDPSSLSNHLASSIIDFATFRSYSSYDSFLLVAFPHFKIFIEVRVERRCFCLYLDMPSDGDRTCIK